MRRFINLLLISFLFLSTACQREKQVIQSPEPEVKKTILYGIEADDYQLKKDTIKLGQTLGKVLDQYGISAQRVDQLDKAAKEIFPLKQIRADRPYILFLRKDSLNLGKLDYFVYEKDVVEYVVFDFTQDSIAITKGEKPVTIKRQKRSSTIESSLWGAIMRDSLPYSLAAEMEETYQRTVDFFGIQKGDNFTVIYDEKLIDSTHVGIGRIWGAKFNHAGKEVYAIPFKQGDKIQYWEYDGS